MAAESSLPVRPKPKGILKKPTTAPPDPDDLFAAFSQIASSSKQQKDKAPEPEPEPQPPTRAELAQKQEQAARIRLLQKLAATELKPPVPLEVFEILSQFPRNPSPTTTASNPSPSDTSYFLTALFDFQPSEYLDLIEERNCLGKCGYTLCPRPRRTHSGPFKIASRSGHIARTEDLNKWCSDACALRALYLKVQLDNPSYVRREGDGKMVVKLELREEKGTSPGGKGKEVAAAASSTSTSTPGGLRGSEEDRNQLAQAMAQLEIDKQKQVRKDAAALAGERGDAGGVFTGVSRVEVTIREKTTDGPVQAPAQEREDGQSTIEGYKPTFGTAKKPEADGHESDDGDDDDFFTVRL